MTETNARARCAFLVLLSCSFAACGAQDDTTTSSSPFAGTLVDPGSTLGPNGSSTASNGDPAAAPTDDSVAPSPYTSCPAGSLCSALYPPDWSATTAADDEGRALPDFSFAG